MAHPWNSLIKLFRLICWIIVSRIVDADIIRKAATIIGIEALIAGFLN